jgi:(p)ppGpp synthase/HD superfamily hydrolase
MTSRLVVIARALAEEAHATQRRKGTGQPYFVHLESVAARLIAHGHDDEVTLAAAYLHDLLEDQPRFEDRLRSEFPIAVVETVELLTEVKLDAEGNKRHKDERFREYVAGLSAEGAAALRARVVSCADKIDNALSLIDAERRGLSLLARLSTRPEQHEVQLATLRPLYEAVVRPTLLGRFDAAAKELAEVVRTRLEPPP